MAEEEENEKQKNKGSIITKILLFGVLPVMTGVVLVLGTLFIAGAIPGQEVNSDTASEIVAEDGEEFDSPDSEEEPMEAIYIPLDPAFVVNFTGQDKARFLQVTIEVMTYDPAVPDLIKLHTPAIRNNLILLLSDQSYENISTLDGKEMLRDEVLEVTQLVLEEETGDPGVEAVYFTSFVMQ
jgi:flagellar FliL protein